MSAPGDRGFVFTVRQITQYVRTLFSQDRTLQDVRVRGELSDCVRHNSGHFYCTLKDDHSQLRAVMFRDDAARLEFEPCSGTEVIARGDHDGVRAAGAVPARDS